MKPLLNCMSIIAMPLTFLFIQITTFSTYGQCSGGNLITDPVEFQWTYHPVSANNPEAYYSGIMEVGEANFVINGQTFTTRAYRQQGQDYSIPGPTLKMTPGEKYVLRFHNLLPYEPKNPNHNVFKDPNVANIHTHGLHISGESPGDDVTRSFEGGRGGDFVYDIPTDHMGGTFWYHAHHHGSTTLQVSGGMFGMIVIDDGNDGIPSTVAAMEEKLLMMGKLDPTAAGLGGDVLMSGSLSTTWTVNGIAGGNICMPPNTWQHWRVALADPMAMLRDIEFGPECEVMVLARDGVWRTVAPKQLATNSIQLTGASRADFAVRTTGNSWIKMNSMTIATISANGTSDPSAHPFDVDGVSSWSANRPSYLRDLRNVTTVHTESISMGARTVNGGKYNHHVPTLALPTNDVQEWSLSGNVRHPFHLHVYHVQALEDDRDFEAGEYYDVVASQMNVRFDLNAATSTPYSGRTIMHCHILEHEDRGAMGWLDVQGGEGPPTFPANGDIAEVYGDYYILGGSVSVPAAPSTATATALSSASIDLSWTDNATDEDGFYIERSTDGTGFTQIGSVDANVVTYEDSGLDPLTTYYYRVIAYNIAGSSDPSNVASATTQDVGSGPVAHVQNITVSRAQVGGGGKRFRGVATVLVYNDAGLPLSGATVEGFFYGTNSSNESGTTDGNGEVVFNSATQRNPSGEWCFEVSNITAVGGTYDAATNVMDAACESGPQPKSRLNAVAPTTSRSLDLYIYPNPISNLAHLEFELVEDKEVVIELYDLLGRPVDRILNKTLSSGRHRVVWNSEHLSQGTYLLMIRSGNDIQSAKIILER